MTTTPTLPRIPAGPSPTRRDGRRIVAIVGAVALVAAAIVAVAYAGGWFDSAEPDTTPIVEPDAITPDQPAAITPDQPGAVPETSDHVAPDPPDEDAPRPRFGEEPRANWDVTGVAASDVLSVRNGPGTTYGIVATLAHDAAEFESTGRIAHVGDQLWREVIVPGDGVGWVNAAYLTPTG